MSSVPRTDLSLDEAADLIEDPSVGFAYVSQREYAARVHTVSASYGFISKKRPPWAATEKAQQLLTAADANYMVIGYYHPGYETPLLQLIWERGFRAGLVVKGEEGNKPLRLTLGQSFNARAAGDKLFPRISACRWAAVRIFRWT